MPEKTICNNCKGKGYLDVLINQNDTESEIKKCDKCEGKGFSYTMTDEENNKYWEDYW